MLESARAIAFVPATDLGRARDWYEGMDQDPAGVWTTPGGDQIAWFRDPDGNVLSLTQFHG
jgi:hypothetical protein